MNKKEPKVVLIAENFSLLRRKLANPLARYIFIYMNQLMLNRAG